MRSWRFWSFVLLVTLVLALVLIMGSIVPRDTSFANHIKGTYTSHGYHWGAHTHSSPGRPPDVVVLELEANCCAENQSIFSNLAIAVANSTNDTSELRDRYLHGIAFSAPIRFDGVYALSDDIRFEFLAAADWCAPPYGTGEHDCPNGDPVQGAGGENHSISASFEYCGTFGHSFPCGYFPSRVHINQVKWNVTTDQGKVRLLLHETGHSPGLDHHCKGDSIMNDGSSACNRGRWLVVTGWEKTDRLGFRNIYPFWPYSGSPSP